MLLFPDINIYHYIMEVKRCQDSFCTFKEFEGSDGVLEVLSVLEDRSSSGKVRPWAEKKSSNERLANIYWYLAYNVQSKYDSEYYFKRSDRLRKCATYLRFQLGNDNLLKLKNMSSCRVRLCPMCAWRRTLKISSHARKIFDYVESNFTNQYDYLLLTLTVPNCKSDDLSDTITHLMKSFARLMDRKEVKTVVKGWYRGLEVTFNKYEFISEGMYRKYRSYYESKGLHVGDRNPNFNTYHPHFHVILAVPKSYLSNTGVRSGYLSNTKWLEIWRECTCNDDITQVDIRPIRAKKRDSISSESALISAICEVTKYAVKDSDYIVSWDWDLSAECVATLDKALFKRRLVAWGGIFKKVHKLLNLDDEVDGDLINIDDDNINISGNLQYVDVFWHVGYHQYVILN